MLLLFFVWDSLPVDLSPRRVCAVLQVGASLAGVYALACWCASLCVDVWRGCICICMGLSMCLIIGVFPVWCLMPVVGCR